MRKKQIKSKSMGDLLSELMEQEGARERMLLAVLEKAEGGDMKSIEFVRDVLGEKWKGEQETVSIKLGKGVEELCK